MGVDLTAMQLINTYSKVIRFLFCASDSFSKYAWVVPLNNTKGVSIINAFQKVLDRSKRKVNVICLDQGSEFYNSSIKKWLKHDEVKVYSTYSEGKSVVAERFIKALKNKVYNC